MPPPLSSKITAMPGSLDSAKAHVAEAMKDIKTGNLQAADLQLNITNQIIARSHQGMLNLMNAHKTPSPLMTGGDMSQQQEMLKIMNSNRTPSPLMTGGGAGNPQQQQETQNMLSMLKSNSNTTTGTMGGNNTTAKK
jgi:cellobiose-specific phosphotransferase system component IIA